MESLETRDYLKRIMLSLQRIAEALERNCEAEIRFDPKELASAIRGSVQEDSEKNDLIS